MRAWILGFAALVLFSSTALADDYASQRDIEGAVDSYLATGPDDATLVGGPGSAGYDAGFWIRGGDFLLRINATLQARFESWNWDDEDDAEFGREPLGFQGFAGDTSGFSLPRATLKLSGEAPCNICWYIELEFGHFGRDVVENRGFGEASPTDSILFNFESLGPQSQSQNYDNTREAWIEWCYCPAFNFRMGQVGLPTTRQLMTAPELQQFVDISYASSCVGNVLPGYTDRNRDHGFLVHGVFGCNNEWSYVASVTNGDGGDSIRNVLDHRTSDNLAYAARVNWAFLAPIGYEEGALRQQTCQWYGEVGVWGFFYADRVDKSHANVLGDFYVGGADLALGWGGFSLTAAYSAIELNSSDVTDFDATTWLVQFGYHFPGTAWEVAGRVSVCDVRSAPDDGEMLEWGFALNYYLNGHGNKLQLDLTFIEASDDAIGVFDPYAGFQQGFFNENSATLLRFQWQLAL